jgi:hypothetical protein
MTVHQSSRRDGSRRRAVNRKFFFDQQASDQAEESRSRRPPCFLVTRSAGRPVAVISFYAMSLSSAYLTDDAAAVIRRAPKKPGGTDEAV